MSKKNNNDKKSKDAFRINPHEERFVSRVLELADVGGVDGTIASQFLKALDGNYMTLSKFVSMNIDLQKRVIELCLQQMNTYDVNPKIVSILLEEVGDSDPGQAFRIRFIAKNNSFSDNWDWSPLALEERTNKVNFKNKPGFKALESNIIRNLQHVTSGAMFMQVRCYSEYIPIKLDDIELGETYHILFEYNYDLDPWSHLHHEESSNESYAESISDSLGSGSYQFGSGNTNNSNNNNNTTTTTTNNNNDNNNESKNEDMIDGMPPDDFLGIAYLCHGYGIKYDSKNSREKLLREIESSKFAYLKEDELRKQFKSNNFACLVTGSKEDVVMAHICPKKVNSFQKGLRLFRYRNVWTGGKKFLTPHDVRNVLPLTSQLKKEFDALLFSFIYDSIDNVWSIFAPFATFNDTEVLAHKLWSSISNSEPRRTSMEKRITDYINNNDTFKRCLGGHLVSMLKRHGMDIASVFSNGFGVLSYAGNDNKHSNNNMVQVDIEYKNENDENENKNDESKSDTNDKERMLLLARRSLKTNGKTIEAAQEDLKSLSENQKAALYKMNSNFDMIKLILGDRRLPADIERQMKIVSKLAARLLVR